MDIVIDFDGTVTTHDFPRIGKDIGAIPVLKKLVENGHRLILFTMRSNFKGNTLDEAVNWFKINDITLFGIQSNPTQSYWTKSPKAYGQLIIDDAALGCPLKVDSTLSDRPFVDWARVESILMLDLGLIAWKPEIEVKDIDFSKVKGKKFNPDENV